MQRILPPALKQGARIAVLSLAGAANEDRVRLGVERLASLGYEPVLFPTATKRGPIYFAGTAEERAADLHRAFVDESIDAIISTRGGWGSVEILPHLDAELIRKHPKPLIGYSDITSVHGWLTRETGLVSFYAPMVAADFARGEFVQEGVDSASWNNALKQGSAWQLGAKDGLHTLQEGSAGGTLFGGCISIVAESLGTPYAMQAPEDDAILFVEDVGTKPYQWDRYLVHLRYGGLLERVKGIVFGDMKQCVSDAAENALLEEALRHNLRDFKGPIAIGLRCGHVYEPNISLPLAVRATLITNSTECTLRIEEAAVTL
ncbi:MAG: LD-carboxypeptidase [Acidobacteria bacterium]|nr:LD-carboxypeptidase [Acidobacteriota bacterium]